MKYQRKIGDVRRFEDVVREVFFIFLVVLLGLNVVIVIYVNKDVQNLQLVLGMDIKILEGIVLLMIFVRMV